jgi:hypothetical protein
MAKAHPISPLPAWSTLNSVLELWHGTTQTAAQDIQANGVDLTKGRHALDFGQGFYTTTSRDQAEKWARVLHSRLPGAARSVQRPAILLFRVPLGQLAQLESLMFVRGDSGHDAFWSFVAYCRGGTPAAPRRHLHPNRSAPNDWYDVVCGPVALRWPPDGRVVAADWDQFSFHTGAAVAILDSVRVAGAPAFQVVLL